MTKAIITGTLFSSLFLNFAAYFAPMYPVTWFASVSPEFALLRGVLAALLVGLLLTNPPRKIYFRAILGLAAVITLAIASVFMVQFKIAIFDFLLLMLVSTIFVLTAIEPDADEVRWQRPLHTQ